MKVKEKGNRFERIISQKLSLWISSGDDKNLLWRSTSSGARATISNDLDNQCGDIASDSRIGYDLTDRFLIECKHYKSIQIEQLLWRTNKSGDHVYTWWLRYNKEAKKYNKDLMLICRQNSKRDVMLVNDNFIDIFEVNKDDIKIQVKDLNCNILILDDFIRVYNFDNIYL